MTESGQVPTHTLRGGTVEADTSVTSFLRLRGALRYVKKTSREDVCVVTSSVSLSSKCAHVLKRMRRRMRRRSL
ncbi:hypothetical protein EYF80_035727 [Liparis tanakae]|uniref:Uncharacterized protein n=1 Tax=Liparis tanakae TaxID=230148 RepID=A0A4Z2GKN7_9TELE|nr:hypothetical protein EYF80_035727 [Liparis tanakae]